MCGVAFAGREDSERPKIGLPMCFSRFHLGRVSSDSHHPSRGLCTVFLFSSPNIQLWEVLLFHSRSVGEVNDNFLNKYEVNPCLDKYNMEHDLLMSHICVMVLKFKPIQGLMRRRQ